MGTPSFTNRLIHEKSPYLQQHAHNPVDWYPWGVEAFEEAKKQNKPIFLSIGYATCHWCHVMEKESFTDPQIAGQMNKAFVNIKVDREELPEVDSLYMEFAQALMASAGGWPLNLILTPELKPFFAVTYLPPANRRGMLGMGQFIQHIEELWQSGERDQLIEQADKIVQIFSESAKIVGEEIPREAQLKKAVETFFELMDPVHGGLKGEPKFPMGYQALFLLDFAALHKDSRALYCVELTLSSMQRGGIYDHLGGGFSRYAVDERWEIPHFEKMLYDNALLARTYSAAWSYTRKPAYRRVSEETCAYLLREMRHVDGGFYSAEDADIEGREGMFYTWTPLEIRAVLTPEEAGVFCEFYGVSLEGNFEGRSVLHLAHSLEEYAEESGVSLKEIEDLMGSAKARLLKKRQERPRPFKDDKVITSWNALAIDALARCAYPLGKPEYLDAALKAADFLKTHLWKEGHLLRRWREAEARFSAGLDDYSFLIQALLTLFEEGCGTPYLSWALELAGVLEREFKMEGHAFYSSLEDPHLLIRKCEYYDGAEPSGNAVHAENLLRLYQITREERYLLVAEDLLKSARHYMEIYPPGACYHLIALQRYLDKKAPTVVVALDAACTLQKEIHSALHSRYIPHLAVIWKKGDDAELLEKIPSLVDKNPVDGQTAVYICYPDRCLAPLLVPAEIFEAIEKL
ncbi:MAG: thioredoxin domain-containing protein [Verrucomicrobia bacterium]|nr:thioredoxin domain-containing protein [Verrucomicrobiota bacterium]